MISDRITFISIKRLTRLFTYKLALVLLWYYVLNWGERTIFTNRINTCQWSYWNSWNDPKASPHHLIAIADPQLVDPHTYPGRLSLLNSLTQYYTDSYLRKSYTRILQLLDPDTVVFLGDLFDGGREWSTKSFVNPDLAWKSYGDEFWDAEYHRFMNIFHDPSPIRSPSRNVLWSLPGNHDLGFGAGVHIPIRNRFHKYFGNSNRVDIIGNHTFVSLDSVSLSAHDGKDPDKRKDIWSPSFNFLSQISDYIQLAFDRDLVKPFTLTSPVNQTQIPSVLLSHVPLYRPPFTPCGPLREHRSRYSRKPGQPPNENDLSYIRIAGGHQYQNVLSPDLSHFIAQSVPQLKYAFSGDDHDYCMVFHNYSLSHNFTIQEITIKSISWVMGVRLPGFQMISMWNPLHNASSLPSTTPTLQSQLCVLPDQISIFMIYAFLAIFSSLIIAFHSVKNLPRHAYSHSNAENPPCRSWSSNSLIFSSAESEKLFFIPPTNSKSSIPYNLSRVFLFPLRYISNLVSLNSPPESSTLSIHSKSSIRRAIKSWLSSQFHLMLFVLPFYFALLMIA